MLVLTIFFSPKDLLQLDYKCIQLTKPASSSAMPLTNKADEEYRHLLSLCPGLAELAADVKQISLEDALAIIELVI